MPMLIESFSLATIFLIGILTSYEDIRTGKIRNAWIITGFICAFFFYYFEYFFRTLPFGVIFTNFIISSAVAFTLWNLKYWSAGDAKLFSLYSVLVPVWIYHKMYFHFFPSFNILYYTFIPAAIYLLILSLIDFIINKGKIKPEISSKNYIQVHIKRILCFTFIFFANQLLISRLSTKLISTGFESNILFLILFFLYRPISIYLDNKNKKFISLLFISMITIIVPIILSDPAVWSKYIFINIFRSLILMAVTEGYDKITSAHIAGSKNKTLPFAPWIFLGVLIAWFTS